MILAVIVITVAVDFTADQIIEQAWIVLILNDVPVRDLMEILCVISRYFRNAIAVAIQFL